MQELDASCGTAFGDQSMDQAKHAPAQHVPLAGTLPPTPRGVPPNRPVVASVESIAPRARALDVGAGRVELSHQGGAAGMRSSVGWQAGAALPQEQSARNEAWSTMKYLLLEEPDGTASLEPGVAVNGCHSVRGAPLSQAGAAPPLHPGLSVTGLVGSMPGDKLLDGSCDSSGSNIRVRPDSTGHGSSSPVFLGHQPASMYVPGGGTQAGDRGWDNEGSAVPGGQLVHMNPSRVSATGEAYPGGVAAPLSRHPAPIPRVCEGSMGPTCTPPQPPGVHTLGEALPRPSAGTLAVQPGPNVGLGSYNQGGVHAGHATSPGRLPPLWQVSQMPVQHGEIHPDGYAGVRHGRGPGQALI